MLWWSHAIGGCGGPQEVLSVRPKNQQLGDFPGGAVVNNLPADAGDTGSSPRLGGSHMPRGATKPMHHNY